ncbi:MAG: hypothetical protein GF350_09895 [Chitinivibrionales bacterium]|nr:hypothetical protein [Chitinivibrionales bacterium]
MVAHRVSTSFFLVAFTATVLHAQVLGDLARTEMGVGARALALGNNYSALANDPSSLFWNPAGITFAKRNNFQLSFGGLRVENRVEFRPGNTVSISESEISRVQAGNAAYVHNFSIGNDAAFGIAYQNPYAFDAVLGYAGTSAAGNTAVAVDNWYHSIGRLDFWTGGFGIRIIPEIAVGLAVSLVTGHSADKLEFLKTTNGEVADPVNDYYLDDLSRDYCGYDARLGLRFRPSDYLALGMRIEFPSYIGFSEWVSEVLPAAPDESYSYAMDGHLSTGYSGAIGGAFTTRYTVITGEVTARAPDPGAFETEPQHYWKIGAGAGIEIPFIMECLSLRGGYAWKEYAPYPYRVHYDGYTESENCEKSNSFNGEHMISAGIGYTVADMVSLELAASHRLYELSTASVLDEKHQSQRVLGSIGIVF